MPLLGAGHRRITTIVAAAALSSVVAQPAAAAPGDLDATFDGDGIATTPFTGGGLANGVAIQPDGKIVAGGYTGGYPGGDFALVRHNADGSLDTGFGSGGKVVNPVGSTKEFSSEIVLLDGGKILQVGTVDLTSPTPSTSDAWFGLARYRADGTVDPTFDGDGAVTTNWTDYDSVHVGGVVVDEGATVSETDDRYIVVGSGRDTSMKLRMLVARYEADGSLDPDFGMGGLTSIVFPGDAGAADAVLQAGGKIVVGGHVHSSPSGFALARLNPNGATDTTFGSGGRFTHAIGTGNVWGYDLIEQPDGKLLVGGQVEGGSQFGIARYTPDGALDLSFDGDGMLTTAFDGIAAAPLYELALQQNGKIVATGGGYATGGHRILLARYTPAGALDPDFSADGKVVIHTGDEVLAEGVAIQPDGRIVLAGALDPAGAPTPGDGTSSDLAVARFEGDPVEVAGAPKNTAPPQIPPSPDAKRAEGETLTGVAGTWTGEGPITSQFIWLSCAAANTSNCKPVTKAGALAPYRLADADIGMRIRLAEVATNAHGSTPVLSAPTAIVSGQLDSTAKPTIYGPLFRRGTLRSVPGGWSGPQPLTFKYAWESCEKGATKCQARGTAADQSVGKNDVGRYLRVHVAATDARGAVGLAHSDLTPVVGPRPKMPDLQPSKKKKGGFSFLKVAGAKDRLERSGLCIAVGPACGFRLPVELSLNRRGKQDVPREFHGSIKSRRVFAQNPPPGDELGPGEELKVKVFDARENELCKKYLDADINTVKGQLGTDPAKVFEKLAFEYCAISEIVRRPSAGVTKAQVYDINKDRSGKAFVLYIYDPLPKRDYKDVPRVDADGDGLWDQWETDGVDVDRDGYIDLELPAMGADPRRKDVFIEIDYMENHALLQGAIDAMSAAFSAAPVPNPNGQNGITVHVDNGPGSLMNPRTGAKWDERSDSNQLPHSDQLGEKDSSGNYDWTAFQRLKDANFLKARSTVFRYVVSLHSFSGNAIGKARDMPDIEARYNLNGPSDMIVAATQPCTTGHCPLTMTQQAVNLMHELGHLLGLGHGGRAGVDGPPDHTNGKPNYFSIMNYLFSFNGLKRADGTFRIDYSRFPDRADAIAGGLIPGGSILALDESKLSETGTQITFGNATVFASGFVCAGADGKKVLKDVVTLNTATDWNCADGARGTVASDLNNDAAFTILKSRDDWSVLKFTGGAVGDFNAPPPTREESAEIEPTFPEILRAAQVISGDAKRPKVKVSIGRPSRRGKVKLRFAARDNRALAQLVVLLDGEQRTFALKGKKAARKITVGPGRHRILVQSQDAVGNLSKAFAKRFRARSPKRK